MPFSLLPLPLHGVLRSLAPALESAAERTQRQRAPPARLSGMRQKSAPSAACPADPYNSAMDISDDELRTCVRVLRTIEADRSHLTRMTREDRRELLTLAGLVAKPERHHLVRMAKAFRRAERNAAKEQDRQAMEQAALRVQRRSPVYAPLRLEPPKREDLDERPRLNK